jgi:hypothetical protein
MSPNFSNRQDLNRRRSEQRNAQKSRGWAVATPLCAAFSRPTPSAPRVATTQVIQQTCSLRRRQNFKQTAQQT